MSYIPSLREVALPAPRADGPAARHPDRAWTQQGRGADVGLQGRSLFSGLRLWRRATRPRLERVYWYSLKPLLALGLILWYTPRLALAVRRRFGVPIAEQVAAQCRLAFREWVNPRCYYFHEHYRRRGAPDVDGYVMRHEIKEGLLKSLHKLQPKVHGARINLGHKLDFAEACADFGLPTPEILAYARRGKVIVGDGVSLEQDLFVKPEQGRGAMGARHFVAERGSPVDIARRLKQIARASWLTPRIVQPLLQNHPELADLAGQSLVTIRVFTCIDAADRPVVTHGMLRSIGKLEPDWPTGEEFAAPIDLASGRLGRMCGDSRFGPDDRSDHHPMTGAPVAGRAVPFWPAIHALARAAHRLFADRILVGWDIALTPQGPVLLEGNSYPDTEFLQRVHDQPIGASPLGPLLSYHLDRLEHLRGRFWSEL
ncbi:MAG TPA: sugar-transfer associated ATP-grasp domain-containing protein [Dongiaceae bacterium]|nr:sugar-transfer associated ATP-grasp domain-containing protein [Dongiaceae bacterium]